MTAHVLWLYGADAVGKSAVGWEAYTLLAEAGEPVAYVDTDYLGFCTPAPADQAELVRAEPGRASGPGSPRPAYGCSSSPASS